MAINIEGKCALIINECQRGVIEPSAGGFAGLVEQVEARGIVLRIAALASAFRAIGLPVFHLPIAHRPDFADVQPNNLLAALARKSRFLLAGSAEAQIVDALAPAPGDFVVARSSGLIGFLGTPLDAMLRRMEVSSVVLTGVSTNVAIAGCAMVATELGYHVIVAEDCIAASDPVTHDVIVANQLRMVARIANSAAVGVALNPAT